MSSFLCTIGHSTRSIEDFIQLLQAHGIRVLVDVRAIPYSRRNPQFNTDVLAATLKKAGMQYHSLPAFFRVAVIRKVIDRVRKRMT